ncbi:MAG TPA: SH3 domain-containing protein [Thermoanaerobaculia bacterium]|nr:SH3 domain-containing protein [Thermoanaerobaculia bacterium]
MKQLWIALLAGAAAVACGPEPLPEPTDTRLPIATAYVSAPELLVRSQPSESAPVVTKYQSGEGVSILVRQGEWVEIRTGDTSGWVRAADLGSAAETQLQADNPVARFIRPPGAVTNLQATGEIYIEADVNTDGDVVATRIITNTTGSEALAAQNAAALRQAKFYPILQAGERKPFKYYHRVSY